MTINKKHKLTINQHLSTVKNIIDKEFDKILPHSNSALFESIRYSCCELNGKKMRPFLFIEILKILDISLQGITSIAAAIELIHVYSLIHDDLPALDNDDYRKGNLTCHKKFGESTAILAGNSLLTCSFELISSCVELPKEKRLLLISELAQAIGWHGMIKGQYLDLAAKTQPISTEELLHIYQLKTGKLISFACNAAAIIGNCSQSAKSSLNNFANNFALAFQLADDISDFNQDNTKQELNLINKIGLEETKKLLDNFYTKSIASLSMFGNKAENLKEFTTLLIYN